MGTKTAVFVTLVAAYFFYSYFREEEPQQNHQAPIRAKLEEWQREDRQREERRIYWKKNPRGWEKPWSEEAQNVQRKQEQPNPLVIYGRQQQNQQQKDHGRFIPVPGDPVVLHGYAKFVAPKRTWTSRYAAARFEGEYIRETKEIRIEVTKFYRQANRNDPSAMIQAQFDDTRLSNLKNIARDIFMHRINGTKRPSRRNTKQPEHDEDGPHEEDLCERCKELGYNCARNYK